MQTQSRHQEELLQLSSTLSKMLKQKFGKGPESCTMTNQSNRLTVFIRSFMTPAEEVLLESHQLNLAYHFRYAVMERVFQDFKREAEAILGVKLTTYYNDWDYQNNTGVMLFVIDGENEWETTIHPKLRISLLEQINFVSSKVHKVPNNIKIIKLNANMFAAECQGTMLQIEKVLYEKNFMDILQERTREIKQSYLAHTRYFNKAFDRVVEGLFMTWDYKNDRQYIFFYLK